MYTSQDRRYFQSQREFGENQKFASSREIGSSGSGFRFNLRSATLRLTRPYLLRTVCPILQLRSPNCFCLLFLTGITSHLSRQRPPVAPLSRSARSCAGRLVFTSPSSRSILITTTAEGNYGVLGWKHRKIEPGLYGYGTYTTRILSSRRR